MGYQGCFDLQIWMQRHKEIQNRGRVQKPYKRRAVLLSILEEPEESKVVQKKGKALTAGRDTYLTLGVIRRFRQDFCIGPSASPSLPTPPFVALQGVVCELNNSFAGFVLLALAPI